MALDVARIDHRLCPSRVSSGIEPMSPAIQLEVCIESVESACAAQQGGAARVEVCSALTEGGITPSAGLIAMVRRSVTIAIHVLIRPRAGDFCYSKDEFEVIKRDITLARQLGANGVAVGILEPDGSVDIARTRALVELASPMQVTFHRAFDFATNPAQALVAVLETGATRILTSGGASTAEQGSPVLRALVESAGSRIAIMAAGTLRENNVAQLIRDTGVREVHANLASPVPNPFYQRTPSTYPGNSADSGFTRTEVSASTVASFLQAASEFP
jgi:copper homeostasis protein